MTGDIDLTPIGGQEIWLVLKPAEILLSLTLELYCAELKLLNKCDTHFVNSNIFVLDLFIEIKPNKQ